MKKEKSVRNAEIKAAIVKQLKSMIAPVVILAIIVAAVLVVVYYKNTAEEKEIIRINGYEGSDEPIVLENDKLKLTMDPLTTQFSLEVKSSGKVWYSNPPDAASDPLALSGEKGNLQSTLLMSYSIVSGLESKLNNYDYSIKNGVYEIETGDDYIRVNYSIGNIEREYMIPPVTTEDDFNGWLDAMSKEAVNMAKQYYKKYDINNLGKKDNKEELLASYPIMETEVIYVLRTNASAAIKTKLEEYFEEAGYTLEKYAEDKELNLAEKSSNKPVFNVGMTYRLVGDEFEVAINLADLESKDEYPIYTLTPLPYFGAGGADEEGFILVPEGGGALINFNNGRTAQNSYYVNMYGWDMALGRKSVVHNTMAYFNCYGIAQGDDSFLCVLEEGAPYASVQADISGRNNSYNTASTVYSVTLREQYEVSSVADSLVYVYLPELPDETLTQRYRFIDSGSYVDMAKDYQSYLKEKHGDYLTRNDDVEAPVALTVVGAVDKVKQVLGVPVSKPLKLTTYKEAEAMIRELKSEGMNNMSVKLTGWCNGGVNQKILKKVKTISELGSKRDMQSLANAANELGIDLYLNGVTQYEYDSNIFDGFFSYADAARFISKERAELFQYSAVTYAQREGADSYYLLHADLAEKMADNLAAAAAKYGTGVSFEDLGMDLSADYYEKDMVSRQAAKERHEARLKALADADVNIMINMGNEYAGVYSDMITNMDLSGSEYTILDAFVPFYQLAMHGYVNYTGRALNVCGNEEEELLYSAAYGAGLHFSLMRETAFALQKTLYTQYYGSDYAAWHDRMMEIYTRYNAELGHTFNQEMTGHEYITPSLSCTTYEDGTRVYVNFSYEDIAAPDGVNVPARDYKVVR
ncbi:MAG: DUF5696 domain-containing protein [bacterium]|nr:DUF5696 domain-containing protein [bacterium]MCM1375901.1 DUF5696 domain-containing protein [Muribaculum sp.]